MAQEQLLTEPTKYVYAQQMYGDPIPFELPTTIITIRTHFAVEYKVPFSFVCLRKLTENNPAGEQVIQSDLVPDYTFTVIIKSLDTIYPHAIGNCETKEIVSDKLNEIGFIVGNYFSFYESVYPYVKTLSFSECVYPYVSGYCCLLYGKLESIEFIEPTEHIPLYRFTLTMSDCCYVKKDAPLYTVTRIEKELHQIPFDNIILFSDISVHYDNLIDNIHESYKFKNINKNALLQKKMREKFTSFPDSYDNVVIYKDFDFTKKFDIYVLDSLTLRKWTDDKNITFNIIVEPPLKVKENEDIIPFIDGSELTLYHRYKFILEPDNTTQVYRQLFHEGTYLPPLEMHKEIYVYGRYVPASGENTDNIIMLVEVVPSSELINEDDADRTSYIYKDRLLRITESNVAFLCKLSPYDVVGIIQLD
jgi:hypothetical protein